jgi:hypothetical protein
MYLDKSRPHNQKQKNNIACYSASAPQLQRTLIQRTVAIAVCDYMTQTTALVSFAKGKRTNKLQPLFIIATLVFLMAVHGSLPCDAGLMTPLVSIKRMRVDNWGYSTSLYS